MSFYLYLICWNLVLFVCKDCQLVLTKGKLESQTISYYHSEDSGLKMDWNLSGNENKFKKNDH